MGTRKLKNINHRKFVNRAVNSMNPAQAYKSVYPNATDKTASVNSCKILARPEIKEAVSELLDRQGVNLSILNTNLKALIKAKKILVIKDGTIEVQDNPTRLESVKLAYKLHGALKPDGSGNVFNDNRTANINVDSKVVADLQGVVRRLEALSVKAADDEQSGEIDDAEVLSE